MYDSLSGISLRLGHSNICDDEGNMILCSDGMNLYNANLDTLQAGDSLVDSAWYADQQGSSAASQSSIILPFGNGKYYLVNQSQSDSLYLTFSSSHADKLMYHVVDLNANGGAGEVVRRKVDMVGLGTKLSNTQMTACRHANGVDWWLLKQGFDSNIVYKFLFKQDTVLGPFIQRFPAPRFMVGNLVGQSCFSLDGTRYATTAQWAGKVFVADFDRCLGMLTNPLVYDVPLVPSTIGPQPLSEYCQFSPSGRFLYVLQSIQIQQLDLQDNNPTTQWAQVAGLDTTVAAFVKYSTAYLGPDGKLYIGNWDGGPAQMSYFATPDVKGAGSGFTPRGLRFPVIYGPQGQAWSNVSGPPNMPNYALGATNPPCGGLGVEEVVTAGPQVQVYPNPTTGIIRVSMTIAAEMSVTDLAGRTVASMSLQAGAQELNLSALPSGLYLYRIQTSSGTIFTGKLTKQ